jgi:hypothetical protein
MLQSGKASSSSNNSTAEIVIAVFAEQVSSIMQRFAIMLRFEIVVMYAVSLRF